MVGDNSGTVQIDTDQPCWEMTEDRNVRLEAQRVAWVAADASDAAAERLCQIFRDIAGMLDPGRILFIDFAGVQNPLDSLLVTKLVSKLEDAKSETGRGLFRDRYIVIENPNESILHLFDLLLRDKHASLLVMEPDGGSSILGSLPDFLKETLEIVRAQGRVTSSELSKLLGGKKGASARERLHQLYRRGLVTRIPIADPDTGRPSFSYEIFSPAKR